MKGLIIDDLHEIFISDLSDVNLIFDYRPNISPKEVLEIIGEYDVLILRSKMRVDESLFSKATRLKLIGRCGAGIDNINQETAKKYQVEILAANEGNRDAVAEHSIGLILGLLHKINKSNSEIKDFIWDREGNRGIELGEQTVGIIGYGNMGQALAKRLSSFGCKVLAYDKYLDEFPDKNAQYASMEQLYNDADILSLHIPLTEETHFMVDEGFFEKFSKPLIFINTSRGKIVRLQYLLQSLDEKKVVGAGLDVLENESLTLYNDQEKKILHRLNALDNVIVTPHVAGWSVESYRKLSEVLASKVRLWLTKN